MAHSGGIMAAGLGKGRIPWFGKDINVSTPTPHDLKSSNQTIFGDSLQVI